MIASVIVLLSCEWQSQMNKRRPPLIITRFVLLFYCLLPLKNQVIKDLYCWYFITILSEISKPQSTCAFCSILILIYNNLNFSISCEFCTSPLFVGSSQQQVLNHAHAGTEVSSIHANLWYKLINNQCSQWPGYLLFFYWYSS